MSLAAGVRSEVKGAAPRRQRPLRAHRGPLAADSLLPEPGRQTRGKGPVGAVRVCLVARRRRGSMLNQFVPFRVYVRVGVPNGGFSGAANQSGLADGRV